MHIIASNCLYCDRSVVWPSGTDLTFSPTWWMHGKIVTLCISNINASLLVYLTFFSTRSKHFSETHSPFTHTNVITNNIPHNEQEKWLPCFPQSKATMECKTGWLIIKLKICNGTHPPMMRAERITLRVLSCIEPWCGTQSLHAPLHGHTKSLQGKRWG